MSIKMKNNIYSVLLALCCFATSTAQSGWTKNKNSYFLKLEYGTYKSTDFRNIAGNSLQTSAFSQHATSFYSEYGVSNKFTAISYIPIYKQNGFETTNRVGGFGDIRLELKYALLQKKFPVSLSIAPEFPTGEANNFARNNSNSLENINLPSGDGEFNVWTTLAASHSFSTTPIYISVYTAFNIRSKYKKQDFQNQFQSGAEIGYKFFDKLWINTKLFILTGVGERPQFADFIRGNGASYTGVSVGGFYEIDKHFGVTAQYFNSNSAIVQARNIYANNIISVGIVYQKK